MTVTQEGVNWWYSHSQGFARGRAVSKQLTNHNFRSTSISKKPHNGCSFVAHVIGHTWLPPLSNSTCFATKTLPGVARKAGWNLSCYLRESLGWRRRSRSCYWLAAGFQFLATGDVDTSWAFLLHYLRIVERFIQGKIKLVLRRRSKKMLTSIAREDPNWMVILTSSTPECVHRANVVSTYLISN